MIIRELSLREKMILALVARGLTNKQIGYELQIKPTKVTSAVLSSCQKLNARNRAEAVALCLRNHLIDNWL